MNRQELIEWMAGLGRFDTVIEVGVFRGTFARALHRAFGPKRLVLVDPWKKFGHDVYGDYPGLGQSDWDRIYQNVSRSFAGVSGVEIIRATSEVAAARVPDGSADLVYIDANHEYDFVKADIALWFPKVRPGGWIAGHDWDLAGVKRAVAQSVVGPIVGHTTKERSTKSWYARKP